MSRPRILFMLAAVMLFGACPMFAAEYAVGTCKPSLPSYPNISAAVSSVPAGSTVLVCPGTYPEQVVITQPLTLQGISTGNSGQAVIAVPGTGLTAISGVYYLTVSPQVEATTAGPVNITNITVDGTGGSNACSSRLVGIYYGSGSSGTVNNVTVRNEMNSQCDVGILAENGTATNESVTIENSIVHDFDGTGILADTNQSSPSLTVTIKDNYIDGGLNGISIGSGVFGSVTANLVCDVGGYAIFSQSLVLISSNTVTGSSYGIAIEATGASVTSNKISNGTFRDLSYQYRHNG